MLNKAIELIEAQQEAAPERSPIRLMGEQLKDILRTTPGAAELVTHDLEVPEMSLKKLKEKFDAFAASHKTGGQSIIMPDEADQLIREFYGLPAGVGAPGGGKPETVRGAAIDTLDVDLSDFLLG